LTVESLEDFTLRMYSWFSAHDSCTPTHAQETFTAQLVQETWTYVLLPRASCFWSGTDLISLLILLFFLSLLGRPSSKKPKAPSFQVGSGWNLVGLLLK